MKYSVLTLCLLSILSSIARGQKVIVVDKQGNRPVPFATVKVLHKPNGGITSESGEVLLKFESTDSILVTSVGYFSAIFIGQNIRDTLRISADAKALNNITVSTLKVASSYLIGNGARLINKRIKCHFKPGVDGNCEPWTYGEGAEFVELVKLPDSIQTFRLGTVYLPVETPDCWRSIFLNIYEYDSSTRMPGVLLLKKRLFLKGERFVKGKAVIDVRNEQILLSKTKYFFVGMSWYEGSDEGDCITGLILLKGKADISFSRSYVDPDYRWFKFFGTSPHKKEGDHSVFQTAFAVKVDAIRN